MSIKDEKIKLKSNIDFLIWDIASTIESLEQQFDTFNNLEEAEGYIKVDSLIQAMKKDNLYTPEIEKFLEEYLKFYND